VEFEYCHLAPRATRVVVEDLSKPRPPESLQLHDLVLNVIMCMHTCSLLFVLHVYNLSVVRFQTPVISLLFSITKSYATCQRRIEFEFLRQHNFLLTCS